MSDRNSEMVAVPRSVIADLYRFFHHTWEGEGRITEEGSHGKDLLDWRQTMSAYHREPGIDAVPTGVTKGEDLPKDLADAALELIEHVEDVVDSRQFCRIESSQLDRVEELAKRIRASRAQNAEADEHLLNP